MKTKLNSRVLTWLLSVTLFGSISGCATQHQAAAIDFRIPKIELLAPSTAQKSFSANQILNVTHNGQTHQLESLLEWDSSSIRLAIVKFGKRIMTVNYDGVRVDVQKEAFVPDALQGEQVLSDIQLVYWPTEALKIALPADFSITDADDVRTVSYKNQMIYRINYHADHNISAPRENSVHLSHLIYGYEMTVQSLSN